MCLKATLHAALCNVTFFLYIYIQQNKNVSSNDDFSLKYLYDLETKTEYISRKCLFR